MLKNLIKKIAKPAGYQIIRIDPKYVQYPLNATPEGVFDEWLKKYNVSTLLDVGANTGYWAREVRESGFTGRILSFEPQSKAYQQLQQMAHGDNNWEVFHYALGEEDNNAQINISENSVSSSFLEICEDHIKAQSDSRYVKKEMIELKKIDTIFNQLNLSEEIIFMKIDTQGFEKKVLSGAKESLKKVVGIQIEMSFRELYKGETLFVHMVDYMITLGFKLVHLKDGFRDKNTGELLQVDGIFYKLD